MDYAQLCPTVGLTVTQGNPVCCILTTKHFRLFCCSYYENIHFTIKQDKTDLVFIDRLIRLLIVLICTKY